MNPLTLDAHIGPIEKARKVSIVSTNGWYYFAKTMAQDLHRMKEEVSGVTIPQWLITIILAGAVGCATYMFTIGSKYGEFQQMSGDIKEIKIHMSTLDQKVFELKISGAVGDSQVSEIKTQIDAISQKQDRIISKLSR